ncbi:MAG: elongation factor G [Elusimicrobia bacterium]|jgi:elongation factor G|nr:elongation factor G [Elusimicrobiota bacterium]
MNVYATGDIRNIAVCGSSGSGKTQLIDSILYSLGKINRMGKVEEGNTISDYDEIEKERQSSVNSSIISIEYKNKKINFIDTPGYADFYGSSAGAIEVCESVLLVINPHEGVDVAAKKLWNKARSAGKAVIVFINFMDNANKSFNEIVAELKTELSPDIAPVIAPVGKADSFKGIVRMLDKTAVIDGNDVEIPGELSESIQSTREELIDPIAAADDSLMEKYLEGEGLEEEEIEKGLQEGVKAGKIIPAACGSSIKTIGIKALVDFLIKYASAPTEYIEKNSEDFKGIVFKAEAQRHVGQINYIKIVAGVLKAGEYIYNLKTKEKQRLNQIAIKYGNQNFNVDEAKTGDICALIKFDGLNINDTVSISKDADLAEKIDFPVPVVERGVYPKNEGEEEKVAKAFSNIIDSDATLKFEFNNTTKEMVIIGMGSLQLSLVVKKIKKRYNAEVILTPSKIAYRETIGKSVSDVRGKYKKQSGGRGQYGDCVINMIPAKTGAGFEFVDKIVGGRIPSNYIPAVEKGIKECMSKGVIAGYPVVDVTIELIDGSYHDVDSSDMAFQVAGSMAFKSGVKNSAPYILEPIMKVGIKVSNDYTGAVMGDLNSRRGRVLGMEPSDNNMQVVKALIPKEMLSTYAEDLRSITSGEGEYTVEFDHYERSPSDTQNRLVETYTRKQEEENK